MSSFFPRGGGGYSDSTVVYGVVGVSSSMAGSFADSLLQQSIMFRRLNNLSPLALLTRSGPPHASPFPSCSPPAQLNVAGTLALFLHETQGTGGTFLFVSMCPGSVSCFPSKLHFLLSQ